MAQVASIETAQEVSNQWCVVQHTNRTPQATFDLSGRTQQKESICLVVSVTLSDVRGHREYKEPGCSFRTLVADKSSSEPDCFRSSADNVLKVVALVPSPLLRSSQAPCS
jgi:hypothetical protein